MKNRDIKSYGICYRSVSSTWVTMELALHLREFQSFQVALFQDSPGFVLVLFYRLLKSVPVGLLVIFAVFPGVDVGQWVPASKEKV